MITPQKKNDRYKMKMLYNKIKCKKEFGDHRVIPHFLFSKTILWFLYLIITQFFSGFKFCYIRKRKPFINERSKSKKLLSWAH